MANLVHINHLLCKIWLTTPAWWCLHLCTTHPLMFPHPSGPVYDVSPYLPCPMQPMVKVEAANQRTLSSGCGGWELILARGPNHSNWYVCILSAIVSNLPHLSLIFFYVMCTFHCCLWEIPRMALMHLLWNESSFLKWLFRSPVPTLMLVLTCIAISQLGA